MSGGAPSLLSFLDTPVVVGDPDGSAAYVNPAFSSQFSVSPEAAAGRPLAALFDGGAREAVLRAVAEACQGGQTARFRLRQGDKGYVALASPIVADDARVGVVILLMESSATDERFLALLREVQEPLDELATALDHLLEQTGGRRAERYRSLVEDGIRALARVTKWSDGVARLLSGEAEPARGEAPLDPVRAVRQATERVAEAFARAGVALEVLLPRELPAVRGDADKLERALVRLLEALLADGAESESLTVTARSVGRDESASVVISLVEPPSGVEPRPSSTACQDSVERVAEIVRAMGGELRATEGPFAGRTTAIRLPAI